MYALALIVDETTLAVSDAVLGGRAYRRDGADGDSAVGDTIIGDCSTLFAGASGNVDGGCGQADDSIKSRGDSDGVGLNWLSG